MIEEYRRIQTYLQMIVYSIQLTRRKLLILAGVLSINRYHSWVQRIP